MIAKCFFLSAVCRQLKQPVTMETKCTSHNFLLIFKSKYKVCKVRYTSLKEKYCRWNFFIAQKMQIQKVCVIWFYEFMSCKFKTKSIRLSPYCQLRTTRARHALQHHCAGCNQLIESRYFHGSDTNIMYSAIPMWKCQ